MNITYALPTFIFLDNYLNDSMTEIELTNIEDGTFLFDGAGKLTFCSDFCDKVLPGLTARLASDSDMEDVYMAIIALGFKASFPASDRDQLAAGWAIFKSVPGNIDFTSESGQVLRWSARRYGEDEIFAVLSDNTLNSRRVAQAAQLTKMSSISDMSGQIGHDLNNFLTIIQGNLELLETFVAEDEKLSRWVSAATLATERGTNMAKSLLYLGRRRPARRRDVVTGEAIQDTIAKMQDQLACPVQIEVLLSSDLSDVRVDETHFKIVLKIGRAHV